MKINSLRPREIDIVCSSRFRAIASHCSSVIAFTLLQWHRSGVALNIWYSAYRPSNVMNHACRHSLHRVDRCLVIVQLAKLILVVNPEMFTTCIALVFLLTCIHIGYWKM